jgi:prepilin-type N-terminal cleavage/methylation domain-containing protein
MRRAFTLIELMVVVAIITILAALLLPTLNSATSRGRRAMCLNNLKQINVGTHLYAEDNRNTLPRNLKGGAASIGVEELKLVRNYVGLTTAPSPRDRLFSCPADTFYYTYEDRFSDSLHAKERYGYSSYSLNAGNYNTNFEGVAGMKLPAIRNPAKTLLVLEFAAFLPYSWHQFEGRSHYNNSQNMVSFIDGHVSYIKMYWDTNNAVTGHQEAWHYDPPSGYEYKWSGN